ncbi:MAG: hypothetical protein M3P51_06490, partial [Chloroflexota bacterium]|nr:hypothetical protein [Chloroflexota bacterium]
AIPLAWRQQSEGVVELDYTLALAKATTLRDGVHYSTSGSHSFAYRLSQGWVRDPAFEAGSHTNCLHFATPNDAIHGRLSSYGSHRLITLPSKSLYSDGTTRDEHCWHDGATLPVCCLACDAGDDPSVLDAPEFWADLGGRFGADLREELFSPRAVVPETVAAREFAPIDLEWLRQTQRLTDIPTIQGEVVGQWTIRGFVPELVALLRMVPQGWWLKNRYSLELWTGTCGAEALLCEDTEHGPYFYVADHAFGRLLTGKDQPVAVATPRAAQVARYLEHFPGRSALPYSAEFPRVHRRAFSESVPVLRPSRGDDLEALLPIRSYPSARSRAHRVLAQRGE